MRGGVECGQPFRKLVLTDIDLQRLFQRRIPRPFKFLFHAPTASSRGCEMSKCGGLPHVSTWSEAYKVLPSGCRQADYVAIVTPARHTGDRRLRCMHTRGAGAACQLINSSFKIINGVYTQDGVIGRHAVTSRCSCRASLRVQ